MLAVNDSGEQALVAVQTKTHGTPRRTNASTRCSSDVKEDAFKGFFLPRDASVMRIMQGCSEAGMRGDGVPSLFSTGGRVPHSPHFFGLKFEQKLVHCCNWLLTEIISVQQN